MMNRKTLVAAGVVAAAFCGSAMAQELPGLPGVPGVPGVPGLPELPTLPEVSGSIGAGLGLGLPVPGAPEALGVTIDYSLGGENVVTAPEVTIDGLPEAPGLPELPDLPGLPS